MIRQRLLLSTVSLLAFMCVGFARADDRVPGSIEDVWYAVSFSGTPVGIVKDHWHVDSAGVFYENYLEITVSRLGTHISMVARTEELDDRNGEPVRFRHEVVVGGTRMLTTGERQGDSLFVRSEGQGFTNEKRIAWESGAVGQSVLDGYVQRHLEDGETEFSIRTFDLQFTSFRTSRYLVTGEEHDVIQGHEDTFLIVELYENDAEHPSLTSWLDRDFDVRRVVLQQMGMEILIERVTEDMISDLELDPNFDVIRGSMIPCSGYPADPGRVEEVEFRLAVSRPIENASIFNGPNQKVIGVDGGVIRLVVARDILNEERSTDEELEVYLQSDRYIQSDHPHIRAVADSIVATMAVDVTGDGADAYVAAAAAWVNRYINAKGFGQGFASAVDVLRTREGDCTEHAVLLAAILRAAGVPARTAVGLVYSDGSLIGHMWTEAYVGCWRTVDALDPDNNPVRIRIAVSPDERALGETDVANAYSLVGGVVVEVENYRFRDSDQ
jgi:hypothetical protein